MTLALSRVDRVDTLTALLADVTYRSASFDVSSLDDDVRPHVICERWVDDATARHPSLYPMVRYRQSAAVPDDLPLEPGPFLAWVFDAVILPMEHHEAGEWFRVDGVRVFDPHGGEG